MLTDGSTSKIITGFYQHLAFRFIAMTRGGLIGLIYTKLTKSRAGAAESGESAVITLIESDVERIGETWHLLTSDLWASILQLGLSVWLLERQIGLICIAPIVLAIGKLQSQNTMIRLMTKLYRFHSHVIQSSRIYDDPTEALARGRAASCQLHGPCAEPHEAGQDVGSE